MPQVPLEAKWSAALGRDFTYGNDVRFLIDGQDAFQAMYDAIQTTKGRSHFIYLLAWWLDPEQPLVPGKDETKLRALLELKARAGVQIRVMLWGNPGKRFKAHDTPGIFQQVVDTGQNLDEYVSILEKAPDSLSQGDQSHGAIARWINTLPHAAAIVDWLTANPVCSHHQKLLCVRGDDGIIATCGGVDVNADRVKVVSPGKGEPLHDVHAVVRGPAAADLVHVFVQRWDAHPDSRDLDHDKGTFIGRAVPSGTTGRAPGHIVRVAITYNYLAVGSRREGPTFGIKPAACKMERSTQAALLGAIKTARHFIYFEDQYLVSLVIADALRGALARNVQVTAAITGSPISDLPQVWARRKKFIERADPLGLMLHVYYLWDPQTRSFGEHTYVHSKTWIFDDEVAYIGSANVNNRGLSSDSEVGVLVVDKPWSGRPPYGFAQDLRMRLWREHLGINVIDPLSGRQAWDKAMPASRVLPYDRNAGEDRVRERLIPWRFIDPDMEGLPACKYRTQPTRMRQLR